jgi:hypothetical protein
MAMVVIEGKVVRGCQVAQQTLAKQIPLIAPEFPEIEKCHHGSMNIELECGLGIIKHDHETGLIIWEGLPGEQFGFLRIRLEFPIDGSQHTAWIYTPYNSPHRQNRRQVEVIAAIIENVEYGSQCRIHIPLRNLDHSGLVKV